MVDSIIKAIKDFADWLADQFQYVLGYLLGILKAAGERLLQALKWLLENAFPALGFRRMVR
jgi:hypothetical protein